MLEDMKNHLDSISDEELDKELVKAGFIRISKPGVVIYADEE